MQEWFLLNSQNNKIYQVTVISRNSFLRLNLSTLFCQRHRETEASKVSHFWDDWKQTVHYLVTNLQFCSLIKERSWIKRLGKGSIPSVHWCVRLSEALKKFLQSKSMMSLWLYDHLLKFNKTKYKALHLGQGSLKHKYRLGREWLEKRIW